MNHVILERALTIVILSRRDYFRINVTFLLDVKSLCIKAGNFFRSWEKVLWTA